MDFLECKICHVPYDEDNHRPRYAQCGHELCTACLKALIKDGAFECPKCRQKNLVYLPEDLPVCFALIDIIRAFKDRNIASVKETAPIVSGPTTEEVCNIHSKALGHWCWKCQVWLCIECLESHTTMVGCSTTTSIKALDEMKENQVKNIDELLSIFENDTKFMSSRIQKLNDKKKELFDKRQELLEMAEKFGEEVNEICNALEQGNIHKENLIEAKEHLNVATSPHTFSERNNVATHRRQLLHTWCVKTQGLESPRGLLKALQGDKEVYAEMVIKGENIHAKLSQQDERIIFHRFQKQVVSEDCIFWPFGHLQKVIPYEASLTFMELSLGGTVKGQAFIRLDKNLPNIREYMEHIVTGQKSLTLAGIILDNKNNNGLWAKSIPISKMKVTIDSNATSTSKSGDVVGCFRRGKLNRLIFHIASKPKTYENDCCVVFGHVEEGMNVIQECYYNHNSGVLISDCGLIIEQD
ncbi:unnamed protein product [Meganyctiphanes norvegica]|uniref:RING-type domain-containing protein n=1 Tax=Meganyctiphanes norvegica TaxID=48144 RepID=A0AAV2STN9_MEGNR